MDHHHHNGRLAAPERARVVPAALAPLGTAAAAPAGLNAPHKDDDHRLAGAAVIREQGKADNPDCADYLAGDQPADDCQRFTALRARLALAGWTLSRTASGEGSVTYSASRWNRPRELAGLAAVAAFADRVAASR